MNELPPKTLRSSRLTHAESSRLGAYEYVTSSRHAQACFAVRRRVQQTRLKEDNVIHSYCFSINH